MPSEHDIFLSYNRADKDWVTNLAEQIESETIDGTSSSRYLKVWFDAWDIDSGENIIAHINKGLKTSQFAATILSPEYLAAPFPELEWTHMIASDPTNKSRRLIPILRRDKSLDGAARIDLPAPFLALKFIDFRNDSEFVRPFKDLVRRIRGLPPERGQKRSPLTGRSTFSLQAVPTFQPTEDAWEPDRVPDVIIANLVPVVSIPKFVYSGTTDCKNPKEVLQKSPKLPGFVVKNRRIYTFSNLESKDNEFIPALDGPSIVKEATSDWLLDPDRSRSLVDLLNRCLQRHLFTLPLSHDDKGRYFFKPSDDGGNRTLTLDGGRPREVAAKKTFGLGGSFWVHYGVRAAFRRIGARFFIEIEPAYVFTNDGRNPIGGKAAGKLSIQWTGMQRNDDVLRNVSFWARTLSKSFSKFTIATGGEGILCDAALAVAKMPVGIADDHVRIRSLLEQKVDDLEKAAADLNSSGIDSITTVEADEEDEDAQE